MTIARPLIGCLGAGRMGRGIAVAFAYAGHAVCLIDVKPRAEAAFATLQAEALGEIGKTLTSLSRFGLLAEADVATILARISVVPAQVSAACRALRPTAMRSSKRRPSVAIIAFAVSSMSCRSCTPWPSSRSARAWSG